MSLTQHELVDRLGISRGTLHRVLTGSPLVKASTRERVLREVKRLNYVPNVIARGLKTRRTRTIGVVGPAALRLSNINKVNALHLAAREMGYSLLLSYSDGSSEEDANCIRDLRSRMVDGLIAFSRGLAQSVPHFQSVLDAKIPLVTMYPMPGLKADCVYVDTRRAYDEMTSYLIGLGHTDIGLLTLGATRSLYFANRVLGFQDAMRKAGIKINPDWLMNAALDRSLQEEEEKSMWQMSDYEFGFSETARILSMTRRPTALVCVSDENAIGALRAAQLAGVKVPDELALIGYDDKESAKYCRVPLTTMHQPDDEVARKAIALLVKRIEGRLSSRQPVRTAIRATLVVRESCGSRRIVGKKSRP